MAAAAAEGSEGEAAPPPEKPPRKPRARKRKPASGDEDEAGNLGEVWLATCCCAQVHGVLTAPQPTPKSAALPTQEPDAADASDYDPDDEEGGGGGRKKRQRKRAPRKAAAAAAAGSDDAAAQVGRTKPRSRSRAAKAVEPDEQPLDADEGAQLDWECPCASWNYHGLEVVLMLLSYLRHLWRALQCRWHI